MKYLSLIMLAACSSSDEYITLAPVPLTPEWISVVQSSIDEWQSAIGTDCPLPVRVGFVGVVDVHLLSTSDWQVRQLPLNGADNLGLYLPAPVPSIVVRYHPVELYSYQTIVGRGIGSLLGLPYVEPLTPEDEMSIMSSAPIFQRVTASDALSMREELGCQISI